MKSPKGVNSSDGLRGLVPGFGSQVWHTASDFPDAEMTGMISRMVGMFS
jgi:hypothetical protein